MLHPGNNLKINGYEFRRVEDFSVFNAFTCADADLDEYIHKDAAFHKAELIAETYFYALLEAPDLPIAFISLLNDALALSSNRLRRMVDNRVRRYKDYPAVKIGRLGVDAAFTRHGAGSTMVNIVKELFTTNNRTGCRFITVDAYNCKPVLTFYQRNGFDFLLPERSEGATRIMFFDLKKWRAGSLKLE